MKTNKKIGIISTVYSLIYILIIYLSFSFYHLSFNPVIWGDSSRFLFLGFGIFKGAIVGLLIFINLKKE